MLTPFRSIETKLKEKLEQSSIVDKNKVGTVHKAQGKEAEVVIFVLGGNPERAGALTWASAKPNLLNVAVSRAKEYLYVIGNYDRWKDCKYFNVLARYLSKIDKFSLKNNVTHILYLIILKN